ncbi:MAG TPA: tetratricopeptide repeat protein [Oculatellaceae cyanobacterium]
MSSGHCYFAQGDYQKAVDDYSKALEKNPADIRSCANRASAYKKLNQMDKYKADMLKSNQAAIDFVN